MLRTSDNLPYTMMPTEDTSQATRPDQTAPSAIKADDAKPSPEADAAEVENDNKKLELSRLMARFPTLSNTIVSTHAMKRHATRVNHTTL